LAYEISIVYKSMVLSGRTCSAE